MISLSELVSKPGYSFYRLYRPDYECASDAWFYGPTRKNWCRLCLEMTKKVCKEIIAAEELAWDYTVFNLVKQKLEEKGYDEVIPGRFLPCFTIYGNWFYRFGKRKGGDLDGPAPKSLIPFLYKLEALHDKWSTAQQKEYKEHDRLHKISERFLKKWTDRNKDYTISKDGFLSPDYSQTFYVNGVRKVPNDEYKIEVKAGDVIYLEESYVAPKR